MCYHRFLPAIHENPMALPLLSLKMIADFPYALVFCEPDCPKGSLFFGRILQNVFFKSEEYPLTVCYRKDSDMNITIRNIDEPVMAIIGALANKNGKSREEYLRTQIKLIALYPEIKSLDNKYERIAELTLMAIQENTDTLKQVRALLGKR
jgi:hypothetical protein